MNDIRKLIGDAIEELMDAEGYIKCALSNKEKDKALADMYYQIATEEMRHHALEHAQIERLLTDPQLEHEWMKMVWDFEKERMVDWKAKINTMLGMYKT